MSYLYKKPVHHSAEPNRVDPLKGGIPKPIPVPIDIVPEIPEKVDIIGTSHISEITYEEHLKNLEMMCKADRAFMARVREFCEEHKEDNFPNVTSEPPSEHRKESE